MFYIVAYQGVRRAAQSWPLPSPSLQISLMRSPVAERLLLSVGALPEFVDDVIGDLEEERTQREAAGLGPQNAWFTRQIVAALPYALRQGVREHRLRGMLRLLETSLAAWILVELGVVIMGLVAIGAYTIVSGNALPTFSGELPLWPTLPLGVLSAAAVGYTAAWLDRRRPLLAALASGALWAGIQSALLLATVGQTARWQWAMLLLTVVGVTIGGVVRISRTSPDGGSLPVR